MPEVVSGLAQVVVAGTRRPLKVRPFYSGSLVHGDTAGPRTGDVVLDIITPDTRSVLCLAEDLRPRPHRERGLFVEPHWVVRARTGILGVPPHWSLWAGI